eukprot:scaffold1484_cov173-Amphora_coffeaeformis.AAC.33
MDLNLAFVASSSVAVGTFRRAFKRPGAAEIFSLVCLHTASLGHEKIFALRMEASACFIGFHRRFIVFHSPYSTWPSGLEIPTLLFA